MKNFVQELMWRGMIQDIMPGTEEKLMEGSTAAYVGIDPTADSLHIGHMVSIMILKHFQNCGHKPIALVGGATGMIGDPSMKSQERNLLDEATLNHNVACIKAQLSKFLDFESEASNKAELVNNYDWMKNFTRNWKAHHCKLHDGEGFSEEETFRRGSRRNVIHRVHLSASPGLRLSLPIRAHGLYTPDGWSRPVG